MADRSYSITFTSSVVTSSEQPDPEPAVYETTSVDEADLQTIMDFFDQHAPIVIDDQGPTYVYDELKAQADSSLSSANHTNWAAIVNNSIPTGPIWIIRDGHLHPLYNGKLAYAQSGSDYLQAAIKVNFDLV